MPSSMRHVSGHRLKVWPMKLFVGSFEFKCFIQMTIVKC